MNFDSFLELFAALLPLLSLWKVEPDPEQEQPGEEPAAAVASRYGHYSCLKNNEKVILRGTWLSAPQPVQVYSTMT